MDFSDPEQVNSLLFSPRGKNIKSAKSAKFAAQFKDRLWRVCTELDGIGPSGRCREGEFWLNPGETVQTPFGNRTRGRVNPWIIIRGMRRGLRGESEAADQRQRHKSKNVD